MEVPASLFMADMNAIALLDLPEKTVRLVSTNSFETAEK